MTVGDFAAACYWRLEEGDSSAAVFAEAISPSAGAWAEVFAGSRELVPEILSEMLSAICSVLTDGGLGFFGVHPPTRAAVHRAAQIRRACIGCMRFIVLSILSFYSGHKIFPESDLPGNVWY